jgi:hypothetical protein
MPTIDSIFQGAVVTMLAEVFDGPPGQEAYVLNPGDPGLLKQLDQLDAKAASTQPASGKPSVAAHADHLKLGLNILNRWAAGEANPWVGVDWGASWRRLTVSESEWRALRDELRREADRWRQGAAARTEWDGMSAAGALSTVAHTAYHFGAIRQIIAGLPR